MPRTTPLEDAKNQLSLFFLNKKFQLNDEFEQFGIDPIIEWSYRMDSISFSMAMVDLRKSKSPVEAGLFINEASEAIESLTKRIADVRLSAWLEEDRGYPESESKQMCDTFEDQARTARGWPARKQ